MNETDLKHKLFKILSGYSNSSYSNIYFRKLSDRFHAGILDVFICYQCRCIWCELKIFPGKPTPLQQAEIEKICAAGGNAVVISMNKAGTRFYLGKREFAALEALVFELLDVYVV